MQSRPKAFSFKGWVTHFRDRLRQHLAPSLDGGFIPTIGGALQQKSGLMQ